METRTIPVGTHGRYLIRAPVGRGPWPLLVGFHGYRESAAAHLASLEQIPNADGWLIVAVQGLHRFYMKGGDVVASWMTSEDRELAIADNIAYVQAVVGAVCSEFATKAPLIFEGFSQGVAMAFRAAAHVRADGLIVVGGDVPPDVATGTAVPLPPVLYGRGRDDELYSDDAHGHDHATLERLGVAVERVTFEGGHALTPDFLDAASRALARFSAAF